MISCEVDTRKLEIAMRNIPRELKIELGDAFDYIARKFLKTFHATRLHGPPGIRGTPHGIFKRIHRTDLVPYGGIENMGIQIASDSKIARLHEEGGVIKAEEGSLAVPLSARTEMYTSEGRLKAAYKHPRQMKNIRLIKLRGKRWLAKFWSWKFQIQPLFVLKNSIIIRPRLGFYKTWADMENMHIERLNRAVQRAIDKI